MDLDSLEFLVKKLRELGISDKLIFLVASPIIVLLAWAAIWAPLAMFGLSTVWSLTVSGWFIFVLILWVPLAPTILWDARHKGSVGRLVATIAMVLTLAFLLLGSLRAIWMVRGQHSFRIPVLTVAISFLLLSFLLKRRPQLTARIIQFGGGVVLTLAFFTFPTWWQWQEVAFTNSSRVGILVARFDQDTDRKFQAGVIEQLNSLVRTESSLRQIVEVKDWGKTLAEKTESAQFERAHREGNALHASIVVFGTASSRGLFTKVAIVKPPLGFSGAEMVVFVDRISDIPAVDAQAVAAVARILVGFAYISTGQCSMAEAQFSAARRDLLLLKEVAPPETILLYEGVSIVCQRQSSQDRLTDLQRAKSLFEEAANSSDPLVRAASRAGLGLVYRQFAQLEQDSNAEENLRKAIAEYETASAYLSADADPTSFAKIQTNLGVAYEKLSEYRDGPYNLRRALAAHEEALKRLDPESRPVLYAVTRNNLGVTFQKLAEYEDKVINLKKAIEAYEDAGRFLSPSAPENIRDYALIRSNLGDAYGELALHEDYAGNLRKAEETLRESLTYVSLERFPDVFAGAQFKLGIVYLAKGLGSNRLANMREGLRCLSCSLLVFDKLNLRQASVAAGNIRTLEAKFGREKIAEILGSLPRTGQCPLDVQQVLSAMQKWAP